MSSKNATTTYRQSISNWVNNLSPLFIAFTVDSYLKSRFRLLGSATDTAVQLGRKFVFDKVFGTSATQDEIFNGVSAMIQAALDGINVCILSYGPSGKFQMFIRKRIVVL